MSNFIEEELYLYNEDVCYYRDLEWLARQGEVIEYPVDSMYKTMEDYDAFYEDDFEERKMGVVYSYSVSDEDYESWGVAPIPSDLMVMDCEGTFVTESLVFNSDRRFSWGQLEYRDVDRVREVLEKVSMYAEDFEWHPIDTYYDNAREAISKMLDVDDVEFLVVGKDTVRVIAGFFPKEIELRQFAKEFYSITYPPPQKKSVSLPAPNIVDFFVNEYEVDLSEHSELITMSGDGVIHESLEIDYYRKLGSAYLMMWVVDKYAHSVDNINDWNVIKNAFKSKHNQAANMVTSGISLCLLVRDDAVNYMSSMFYVLIGMCVEKFDEDIRRFDKLMADMEYDIYCHKVDPPYLGFDPNIEGRCTYIISDCSRFDRDGIEPIEVIPPLIPLIEGFIDTGQLALNYRGYDYVKANRLSYLGKGKKSVRRAEAQKHKRAKNVKNFMAKVREHELLESDGSADLFTRNASKKTPPDLFYSEDYLDETHPFVHTGTVLKILKTIRCSPKEWEFHSDERGNPIKLRVGGATNRLSAYRMFEAWCRRGRPPSENH